MGEPDWADAYFSIANGFLEMSTRNAEASLYSDYVQFYFLKHWEKTRHDLESHLTRIAMITSEIEAISARPSTEVMDDEQELSLEMMLREQQVLFGLVDELMQALAFYDPQRRVVYEGAANANRIVAARAELDSFLNDTLVLALARDGEPAARARKIARSSLAQGIGRALNTLNDRGVPASLTHAETARFLKANRLRNRIVHGGGRLEFCANGSVTYVQEEYPKVDDRLLTRCQASFMLPIRSVNRAFMSVLEVRNSQRAVLEMLDEHLADQIGGATTP